MACGQDEQDTTEQRRAHHLAQATAWQQAHRPSGGASADQVHELWHAATGVFPAPDYTITGFLAQGWQVADVRRLLHLMTQASTRETALVPDRAAKAASYWAADHLGLIARFWVDHQNSIHEALEWLIVVADAPVEHRSGMHDLVRAAVANDIVADPITTWQRAASLQAHRSGPLAYAAGLTAMEAAARTRAGLLDEADLRVLAGLRGYHLLAAPLSL